MLLRPTPLLVVPALALAAGCSGHGHGPVVLPPVPVVGEVEPNDTAWQAQGLGPVGAWETFQVAGFAGHFDTDGYALAAQTDLRVFVELDAADPFADLDLCVWDPFVGAYVLCLTSPGDEFGSFTVAAGYEFHLVVDAFLGSSPYMLTVETEPLYAGFAAAADDDALATQGPLAAPVRAQTEAPALAELVAERREPFERYLRPAEPAPAPRAVLAPGLPGTPMPLVPMLAPVATSPR